VVYDCRICGSHIGVYIGPCLLRCNTVQSTESQPILRKNIYLWFYSPCGPCPLFQFLNLYTVGRTPWMGDQPVARPLATHRTTQTQNKRIQTSIHRVEFDPTILVFGRAKTVHALDCAATVIGFRRNILPPYLVPNNKSSKKPARNM
jgi:hypothetical protein